MKILLAGPGTGKTTNIKKIISEHGNGSKFLILSFTNATVCDLKKNLNELNISDDNCMTLHKLAAKYNHDKAKHVLLPLEVKKLKTIAKGLDIIFEKVCGFLECTTFDQIIASFVKFAKSNPTYLKEKLSSYDSLIVDEYQDFNPNEQNLIDILVNNIENSYLLGDDDQCIYDFKDASTDKIISFYRDERNEKIPHEHICYRCPDSVVEHATNLIMENKKRIEKIWKKSEKAGEIKYFQYNSLNDVANALCQEIKDIKDRSILVLTPVEFAVLPLIDKLIREGVEFTNYIKESIPKDLINKSWEIKSFFGHYKYLNLVLLGYSILQSRKKFYQLLRKHFDEGRNWEELYKFLEKSIPAHIIPKQENLEVHLSQDYYQDVMTLYGKSYGKTSDEKIENIFKNSDQIEEKNIKIMSIHKSKGLGADYVFMIGLVEGIIPNRKKGNDSIEAQRRLFYVGMTRAKERLYLFSNIIFDGKDINTVNKIDFNYDYKRKVYSGKASSFIGELKLI